MSKSKFIVHLLICLISVSNCLAQGSTNPPPPGTPPVGLPLPIDSGIYVLLTIAIILGYLFSNAFFSRNKINSSILTDSKSNLFDKAKK